MPQNDLQNQPGSCPLCGGAQSEAYHADRFREYFLCRECSLVFVPEAIHLSEEREKAEYDLHQNDPLDQGYRRFLSRLCDPLKGRLTAGACGLDFGCGPGPTLSVMFEEAGYAMATYDKFYATDAAVLQGRYDFVTATEVVEHLRRPRFELERLRGLLKDGGLLGIMTKLVADRTAFASWHYKNDLSHICFFSRTTFEWLARQWGARVEFIGKDVILMTMGEGR